MDSVPLPSRRETGRNRSAIKSGRKSSFAKSASGSHGALAQQAEEIASHLDRASNYLREKELREIYYDAEHK
jgi:hypothetical protein